MSKLNDLILQYCPDGVEWVSIHDIADTFIGLATSVTKFKSQKGILLLHNSDIKEGKIQLKTIEYLDPSFVQKNRSKILHTDDIITVHTGDVGTSAVVPTEFDGTIGFTTISSRIKDKTRITPTFLCCFLNSNICKDAIRGKSISDRNNLNLSSFDELLVPVPPLPVQEEIVRILDNFSMRSAELQTELEAELEGRRKQYDCYRDQLLSFSDSVQWKTLEDIATEWYRGAGIKRDEVENTGFPCVRYGDIHTTYKIWFDKCVSHTDEQKQPSKKYADYGDILFAITSEDIDWVGNSVAYLGKEKIMVGGDIVVMKHNQDPRFLAYALSTTDAVKQKGKGKVKSKVVHTNVPSLQKIVIPVPPIDKQKQIADALDNFRTFVEDLTRGLPAEIEARKQQYEHYRDKLLTFKRKEA